MQAHITRPNLAPLIILVVIVAAAAALALGVLVAANRATGTVTNQLATPVAQTVTQSNTAPESKATGDCAGERWRCQAAAASGNDGTIAVGQSSSGSAGTGTTDVTLRANECIGERWKC
jgi:hypothetical protein